VGGGGDSGFRRAGQPASVECVSGAELAPPVPSYNRVATLGP
jgi:hypothetical protein